mgnify:CR=1 FL=1
MSNRKSKDSWEPDWKFGLDDPSKLSANMMIGWCAVWGMYFRKWIKDCDIDLNVLISKLGLEGKVDVWLDVFNGRRILAAREMIKIEDLQFKPKNWKPLEVKEFSDGKNTIAWKEKKAKEKQAKESQTKASQSLSSVIWI